MQYTVKDILTEPELKNANLLTAEHSITALSIESVSVIELPVENFVREKELVLTTAMGCGSSTSFFLSFVKDIYKSGASALAVAIGRHVQSIPEEVIRFANEHQFPLIELPWEIRFSDIIKKIYRQINFWQEEALKKNDQLQKELLQLFLNNHSLSSALQLLAKHFHVNVLLTYGAEIFHSTSYPTIHQVESIVYTIKNKNIEKPTIIHLEDNAKLQIYPIPTLHQESSYLTFELNYSDSLQQWSVIQQFATTLQLWFQKQQTMQSTKKKEKEQFIQYLINGDWNNKKFLLDKGTSLDYEVNLPYVCVLGQPEYNHSENGEQYTSSNNIQLAAKLNEISQFASKTINRKIINSFIRGKLVLFIEIKNDSCTIANQVLDIFDSSIEKGEIPLFSWGIGENHGGFYTFHEGYKDCMTALEIGRNFKGIGQRSTHANTGMFRILSVLVKDSASIEMMHTIIGKVAAYDQEKGLDLLHTLAVYLKNHCNVSQTSRELSLHRQSLLYRLKKIELLTDRSLNNADDLFLLQLCLQLWTIRFSNSTQTVRN